MNVQQGYLTLRSPEFTDKHKIAEFCTKKVWDSLRDFIPSPYTLYDAEAFIRISRSEDPVCTFSIDYKGKFVGIISLVPQSDVYRLNAEVGYWLGEAYWGKGIISKAIPMIVNYGFTQLSLCRIYAHVFEFNKASQKALLKSGFNLDYIAKKAIIKNGSILDEYRFSIYKPE